MQFWLDAGVNKTSRDCGGVFKHYVTYTEQLQQQLLQPHVVTAGCWCIKFC